MFIFFYMNISLFLRDAGASVRDIFKSNKTKMLVYVAIFVAGMILGFIFFNRIEQTEWLYVHTTDIVIVVVQSNNFFAVWFQNFWKCAKLVLVLFCLNLFSFGRHFHFFADNNQRNSAGRGKRRFDCGIRIYGRGLSCGGICYAQRLYVCLYFRREIHLRLRRRVFKSGLVAYREKIFVHACHVSGFLSGVGACRLSRVETAFRRRLNT